MDQEGINSISEQSETRSWFGQLLKFCGKQGNPSSSSECFIRMKIDHDGLEFLGIFLNRTLCTSEESKSGPNNPNACRAVLKSF